MASGTSSGSARTPSWRARGWDYAQTRRTATDLLTRTIVARGLHYECRHGCNELAVMLVDGRKPPTLMVVRSAPLDADGWVREMVLASFLHDFDPTVG